MKDNNVVAFYCSDCHKTVWNYEHNFEQLHEKGLCAKCLKKQNKPKDKWQKLKKWLGDRMEHYNDRLNENVLISSERQEVLSARHNQCFETIAQMEYIEKELEGEDE